MIVGRGKDNTVYHYQLDHIGTPLDLTNTEGKAVWSAQYLAYGTIYTQHTEEVTNPLRFQGQYFDQETGLHYNRHRYYNPKSGLFTTADPIGLAGGLNNYQYVKNPTGYTDPLGLAEKPTNGLGCKKGNVSSDKTIAQTPDEVEVPQVAKSVTNFSQKQLAKKFKHALDFEVNTTKKNPQTLAEFQNALTNHLDDVATEQKGTYGFVKDSKVFFNSNTNNAVVVDSAGNFVTGFKLSPGTTQFDNFMKNGLLR